MFDTYYYNKELEIDGTAESLYKQVMHGYYDDNVEAMEKIVDILETEKMHHEAKAVIANINYVNENDKAEPDEEILHFAIFKKDIEEYKASGQTGYQISLEEVEIRTDETYMTINGSYDRDSDTIELSITSMEYESGTERVNASKYTYDEIKDWDGDNFKSATGELYYYAQEIEDPDIER